MGDLVVLRWMVRWKLVIVKFVVGSWRWFYCGKGFKVVVYMYIE